MRRSFVNERLYFSIFCTNFRDYPLVLSSYVFALKTLKSKPKVVVLLVWPLLVMISSLTPLRGFQKDPEWSGNRD